VLRFLFDPQTNQINLGASLLLTHADGSPMTGLPNIAGVDEEPVDLLGVPLAYYPFGADLEAFLITPSGDYWMADEYRLDTNLLTRLLLQDDKALHARMRSLLTTQRLFTVPVAVSIERVWVLVADGCNPNDIHKKANVAPKQPRQMNIERR